MTELKPCPFCGQIPIVEESARFPRYGKDEGERIKGYTVVCKNLDCILLNADNWYERSEEKAREAWNHRFEPENRPLTLEEISAKADGTVWSLVWCEHRYVLNTMPVLPQNKTKTNLVFLTPGIKPVKLEGAIKDYDKTWRCWFQRPTIQEAEAIGWEDEI